MLTEELFCLSEDSDSATFLARRAEGTLGLPESSPYHPKNPNSWSQAEMDTLQQLRQNNPDRAFPVIQENKRAARRQNKERWRIINEMEELAVYLGYSRIEFERAFARGKPLPLGMTAETFDHDFSGLLGQKRREYQDQDDASRPQQTPFSVPPSTSPVETDAIYNDTDYKPDDMSLDLSFAGQADTLDRWLRSVATASETGSKLNSKSQPPAQTDDHRVRPQSISRKKSVDKNEYLRLQKAAAQGSAGLYSFLHG